jgi:hypothetical protein
MSYISTSIYFCFHLHTVGAWLNGTINELLNTSQVINLQKLVAMEAQYTRDTETAKQRGFNSIFDDFDHAVHEYKVAEQDDKVGYIFMLKLFIMG